MADSNKLEPITLPTWPACDDCIAWSEDDLAVACSEVVHMLTPKRGSSTRDVSGHPQWHLNTIRVNTFDETEWPYQILASISHFSVGEEQGNSYAIALAWSPIGLGMHKRSVLAILTSNLVLSLWETDGSLGQYKRTCIINGFLGSDVEDPGVGIERRKLRVRAFVWIPYTGLEELQESHIHHLLIVDDMPSITILRIYKTSSGQYGCWSVEEVLRCPLPDSGRVPENSTASALQRRLQQQSPIARITLQEWTPKTMLDDTECVKSGKELISNVKIMKGGVESSLKLSISADTTMREADNTKETDEIPKLEFKLTADSQDAAMKTNGDTTAQPNVGSLETFKQALQPIYAKFNQEHQLDGHYRTRLYGTTVSRDGTAAAACISLHGSDMIEHTIPSAERTTVVFRSMGRTDEQAPLGKSDEEVRNRIMTFVTSAAANTSKTSTLDKSIFEIHNLIANSQKGLVASADQTKVDVPVESNTELNQSTSGPDAGQPSTISFPKAFSPDPVGAETCEICNAEIPFLGDTTSAMCRAGHQFTRCSLSFVSIQEPGISKYCSGCGKQFLDLAKLGPVEGQSLSRALFDTFQVCPYCQAKFRG